MLAALTNSLGWLVLRELPEFGYQFGFETVSGAGVASAVMKADTAAAAVGLLVEDRASSRGAKAR